MKIKRFEDLEVWQLSRILVKRLYELTRNGRFSRDFGLADQIQRSGISVMANIAEGFERRSNREFIQFLSIAKGSCGEVRSHLYIALDVGYIDVSEFNECYELAEQISKSLSGFMKYLKSSATK